MTVLRIPPAVVRVRPLEEKSPPCPANTVPLEKVLVAVLVWRKLPPESVMPEEVANIPPTRRPLKIVDVELATKFPTSWRERILPGVVVPMPTLPDCVTLKSCPCAPTKRVEVATSAWLVDVPVTWKLPPCTERREPGEAVAIPMRSLRVSREKIGVVLVAVAKEKALILEVAKVVVADWR